jgi:carbonic anhydrase
MNTAGASSNTCLTVLPALFNEDRFMYLGSVEHAKILSASSQYAKSFQSDDLTAAPIRKLVVLTCMDARLDLFRLLGLHIGDAHLLRNAGGRATDDAIRSLVLSSHWLGTREFVVIHHTGCGLHGVSNAEIHDRVELATGQRPTIDFRPFDDVELSVVEDVERIKNCVLLPRDSIVWGAVYDVHTGELQEICAPVGRVPTPSPSGA